MPKQAIVEYTIKRGYSYKPETLKKLKELKVYVYGTAKYNEILDDAINLLYDIKMKDLTK